MLIVCAHFFTGRWNKGCPAAKDRWTFQRSRLNEVLVGKALGHTGVLKASGLLGRGPV